MFNKPSIINENSMIHEAQMMIYNINNAIDPIENQFSRSLTRWAAGIFGCLIAGGPSVIFLADANTDNQKIKKINEKITSLMNRPLNQENTLENKAAEFMQDVYLKDLHYTKTAKKLKEFAGASFATMVVTGLVTHVTALNNSIPVAVALGGMTLMALSGLAGLGASTAKIYHSIFERPKLVAEKQALAFNASLLLK